MKPHLIIATCGVAAALCLAGAPARAQQVSNEAQLWLELGVSYEPVRRLRLSVDQHYRFDENLSRAQSLMTELALRYAPLRWLRFAGGYRTAVELDNDDVARWRHRLHFDASTRHRLRPLFLGFRLRFQEEMRTAEDNGAPFRHTLRVRSGIELRRVPLDPSFELELFLRLADGSTPIAARKLRGTLGITIGTDLGDVSVGYRLEGVFADRALRHIILLGWNFDIDD